VAKRILIILAVIFGVGISLGIFYYSRQTKAPSQKVSKIWVEIDPVQCLGNPWEKTWLSQHNNDYDAYPRGNPLIIEDWEKEIIKNYYEKQGIKIFAIKSKTFSQKPNQPLGVCAACNCPQGYTLYLLVKQEDKDKLLNQGYKISSFN
jgi:hypothetical protein